MRLGTRRIQGFEVSADLHGPADASAPIVVLVHGMMEPGDIWRSVLTRLSRGYRCVVLDLPWNGRQGGYWGLGLRPEDWLRTAVEAFELHPDAWIAHSFGASTLLAMLATSDEPSDAPVTLVSPFYKASSKDVTWPLFQGYVNRFTDFVELSIRVRMNHKELDPDVLRRMTEAARDSFGCYVWMNFWQLFARMPFVSVERLTQPVLTLTGAEDFSAPLADALALDAALPNGRLEVYPNCAHFLLSSRGEEAADAMARFLAVHRPLASEVLAAAG